MKRVRALTLAAVIGGCLLRLTHLGAPLTFDEGYTLQAYSLATYHAIVTTYDVPNNHVLLSVMLKAIDAHWPKKLIETLADPWPFQAPSLLGAAASLWLLGEVAAALAGPVAALFAVVVLALSYWHLMYSHMLRGYSLSTALELAALWLSLTALRRGNVWRLFAAALCCACAHYLVPSNAVFTLSLVASFPWLARRDPSPAQGKGRTRAPERLPLSWAWKAAAGVVCAALTLAAYWPILEQVRRASAQSASGWLEAVVQTPQRLKLAVDVLGFSTPWAWLVALCALLGLAAAFKGGRRSRAAGAVAAAYLVVPVAVFSAQRALPFTRIYLPDLPLWCLAFGLAGRAAAARLARKLSSHAARRLAVPALALIVAAAFSTQAAAYLRWNRGVDPRKALAAVSAMTQDTDDFMVIALYRGDDLRFGELNWDYYGYAAKLEPYYRLTVGADVPYQARSRYVVLADDENAARQALVRSGVDEIMLEGLRRTGSSGRMGIFETNRDAAAMARYQEAALGPNAAAVRAVGLTGLGIEALSRGNLATARDYLSLAKALSPDDEKIRYQLGRNSYLALDDVRAVAEFSWVVGRDTQNAHAPFYLADSLAQLGRDEEAMKWYQWYFEPGRPAEAWVLKPFCKLGGAAIRQGKGSVKLGKRDADDWSRAAIDFAYKGAVERAAEAMWYSTRIKPFSSRLLQLASFQVTNHQYFGAAAICRFLLDHGGAPEVRVILAKILRNKNDIEGARGENEKVLAVEPKNAEALDLAQELRRL